jgi:hypothetical protein|tara:strand:+ start:1258 stop:1923 length:666 start_codon:yes stop_codon:yes gene_type:complete
MKFDFINKELTEARYMRTDRDTLGRDAYDIGETAYEQLLMLQQMRFENPGFAKKYAEDTLRFNNFRGIKPGASDLHNLISIVNNPSKYKGVTSGGAVSINELELKRYLKDIAAGRNNNNRDRNFLLKLQKDLGIKNSFLKNARRISADYGRASPGERKALSSRMILSQKQDGKFRSDITKQYGKIVNKKGLVPEPDKKGLPLWAQAAGAFAVGFGVSKLLK